MIIFVFMKRMLLALVLAVLPLMAGAQEPPAADAGAWTSLALRHDFSPRYNLTLRAEHRSKDNCRTTDVWFLRAFNRYKFLPWLTGEANLEFNNSNLGDAWRRSFRIHLGGIASCKLGDFKLSTMQREYFFVLTNVEPASMHFLLSNFRVGYAPEGWAVAPYVSAFWFFRPELFQRRLVAGADIRLTEALTASLYYMYRTVYPSEKNTNILGIGLTVKI